MMIYNIIFGESFLRHLLQALDAVPQIAIIGIGSLSKTNTREMEPLILAVWRVTGYHISVGNILTEAICLLYFVGNAIWVVLGLLNGVIVLEVQRIFGVRNYVWLLLNELSKLALGVISVFATCRSLSLVPKLWKLAVFLLLLLLLLRCFEE